MHNSCKILAFIALVCLLCACLGEAPNAAQFTAHTVDVEKVLTQSRAAKAGQEHLAKVRSVLEGGYAQLEKVLAREPEAEKRKGLAEAAVALQRQLNIEQQAVTNVISQMMLEEVQAWRQANKADLVVARQNVLDAAPGIDITGEIILAMDKKQPKFPDLPKVTVNKPAKAEPKAQSDQKQPVKTQKQEKRDAR